MMYHKELKIGFLLNPECGNASLKNYLYNYNFKFLTGEFKSITNNLNRQYLTYKACIEEYPNLMNYKLYGFFRNPADRFQSAMTYVIKNVSVLDKKNPDPSKMIDNFNYHEVLFREQIEWLDGSNVTVLDFDNFKNELDNVLSSFNIDVELENLSELKGRIDINNRIKKTIKTKYAADYEFAKKVLGKTYE